MSNIQVNNILLNSAFAQYTGAGTNTANTTVVQTQYTLANTSVSGSPVSIDSSGNITFKASGLHHVSITATETSTTGNLYIPQLLNATDNNAVILSSRVTYYGSFSSDVMVDATKKYNVAIYATGSSATGVKYTITFRRIGAI